MHEYWDRLVDFVNSTHIPEQFDKVDYVGLFSNPWFLVPFIILIGYMLYKQEFKNIITLGLFLGCWAFSGTEYMANLTVDGELQLSKVLPIVFGAAAVMGIIIYMHFGRSD